MKRTKKAAIVAMGLAAMALAGASSASATTLETNGETANEEITIEARLKSGTSALLEDTSGFTENTCKASEFKGKTTVKTGTAVTGEVNNLTFTECNRTVTIDAFGQLEIVWTSGTNGTVYSENAQITPNTPFGHLNCKTTTTQLGTLTGVSKSTEHATLHVNANLTCSGISTRWTAEYIVLSPTGLGVSK